MSTRVAKAVAGLGLVLVIALGFGAGCGDDDESPLASGAGLRDLLIAAGDNQAAEPGASLEQPLTVQAVGRGGRPVAGVEVQFSVIAGGGVLVDTAGASTTVKEKITGADGRAEIRLRLGPVPGVNRVAVTVDGLEGMPPTFTARALGTDGDDGGGGTVPPAVAGRYADGSHFSLAVEKLNMPGGVRFGDKNRITAYVYDAASNPVAEGTVVRFRTSGGGIEEQARTNAFGEASVLLTTAGPVPADGWVTVTAETAAGRDSVVATTTRVLFSGQPEVRMVSPDSFQVVPGGRILLVFFAGDANGHPLSQGATVRMTAEGGTIVGPAVFTLPDTQSPEDTRFAVEFEAAADGKTQPRVTVVVSVSNGNVQADFSGALGLSTVAGQADADHFSLAMEKLNMPGGVRFGEVNRITAFVYDANSNPVPEGTVVRFRTSGGGIEELAQTNAAGQAVVELTTAGPVPADGWATVTAETVGEDSVLTATAQVLFSGSPQVELVSPDTFRVAPGGGILLAFYVGDGNGNPLSSGTTVSVAAEGGQIVGESSFELPDTQSPAATLFAVVFKAAETGEVPRVTVVVESPNGDAQALFFGELELGTPELAGYADADHFSLAVEKLNMPGGVRFGEVNRITAFVYDADSNPVPLGTIVRFRTSGGGIGELGLTDAAGQAVVELTTAGPIPSNGLVTVTAETAGAEDSVVTATAQVLFSGEPEIRLVSPDTFRVVPGGEAVLAFYVGDGNGHPLAEGTTVTVTAEGGTIVGESSFELADTRSSEFTAFEVTFQASETEEVPQVTVAVSSPNGKAQATFDGELEAQIGEGVADGDHFSLAMEKLNMPGGVRFGEVNRITAFVYDARSNPVPEGTVVRFRTSGGGIEELARTNAAGQAVVELTTAGPVPADGWATVTAETVGEDSVLTATAQVLFSGSPQVQLVSPDTFRVAPGGGILLAFYVGDGNGNPLSSGTTVSVTAEGGQIVGESSFELPDTQSPAATLFAVVFQAAETGEVPRVTVAVESPNGNTQVMFVGELELGLPELAGYADADHFSLAVEKLNMPGGVRFGEVNRITAFVYDADSNPVPLGTVVRFRASGGGIEEQALTSPTGQAVVELTAADPIPADGWVTVTAETAGAEDSVVTATAQVLFSGEPEIRLVSPDPFRVAPGGSVTLAFYVGDANGHPLASGTTVSVTAEGGEIVGESSFELPDTQSLEATRFTVAFRAAERSEVRQLTVGVSSPNGNREATFVSRPERPEPASIVVVSVDPSAIGVRGAGTNETALAVFEVRDALGDRIEDGVPVFFRLRGVSGRVQPDSTGTVAGRVQAVVSSDTLSGTVQLVAMSPLANGDTVRSEPVAIAVHGGLPDEDHFSLALEKLNVHGGVLFGLEDRVTAFVYDQYANPVPEGTVVYFTTDGGGIEGSAVTSAAGQVSVTLTTAGPVPADGWATVTARTLGADGEQLEATARVLFSGPPQVLMVAPDTFRVAPGGDVVLAFYVGDANGHPLVEGTTVSVTAEGGEIVGESSFELPDTQSPAATLFAVVFRASEERELPRVIVEVESPNGELQAMFFGELESGAPVEIVYADADHFSLAVEKLNMPGGVVFGEVNRITAYVYDANSNPVSAGTVVRFRTSGGGIEEQALTDASGQASVTLTTAGPVPEDGLVKVTAEAAGEGESVVTATAQVLFSSATRIRLVQPANFSVMPGEMQIFRFFVGDENGHPLAEGTTVAVTAEGGTIVGQADFSVPDTQSLEATQFAVNFQADDEGVTPQMVIQVSSPNGDETMTLVSGQESPGQEVVARVATQISVVAEDTVLVADGISETAIRVAVRDSAGNGVANQTLEFSVDAGTIDAVALTDQAGQGVAHYRSAMNPDGVPEVVVRVRTGTLSGETRLRLLGVSLRLLASSAILAADGIEQSTITAVLETEEGSPIPFVPVDFATTLGSLSASQAITDVTGRAGVVYTGVASPEDLPEVEVRARAAGLDAATELRLLGVQLQLSVSPDTIAADGSAQASLSLHLQRSDGVPIPNAEISLETSLGELSSPLVETDAAGEAQGILVAGTEEGKAIVKATYGEGLIERVTVAFVKGPPTSIVIVSVEPPAIGVQGAGANETALVTFEVRDARGNTVADGEPVLFRLIGPLGSGQVGPDSTQTVDGRVYASVRSGTVAGTVQLIALAASPLARGETIRSEPVPIAIHGGHPDQLHFSVSPSPVNLAGRVVLGLESQVTAYVFDQYANPVPENTAVYFTTDGGGIQGSGLTDENGQTRVTLFTANPMPPEGPIPPETTTFLATVTARTVDKLGESIETTTTVLFSGPTAPIQVSEDNIVVRDGEQRIVTFRIADIDGNPLMANSTIRVTSDVASVAGNTDVIMPDVRAGHTDYSILIADPVPNEDPPLDWQSGSVLITVQSFNGNAQRVIGVSVD